MTPSRSSVAYRIETSRLVMRAWSPDDASQLERAQRESRSHLLPWAEWAKKIEGETLDEIIDKLREWRAQIDRAENFRYAVIDKATAVIVGAAGMNPRRAGVGGTEIGYWVHVDWLRRGIATEMAGALTRVAFDVLGLRFVEIRTARSNHASAGIPKKLGFVLEGTLRERTETTSTNAGYDDVLVFCMLDREYAASSLRRELALTAFDAAGRKLTIRNG
jgi:RimJ/RimL family protein N-acetyltransferase